MATDPMRGTMRSARVRPIRKDGRRSAWNHWLLRFWSHVEIAETGCWVWTGDHTHHGYGRITREGKREAAHRVSWELHRGPIPPGMEVCHHCDNPPCIRPDHLFLGTHSDNARDCARKGRNPLITHPEMWATGDRHWTRLGDDRAKDGLRKISELRKKEWASGRRQAIRDERGHIMGTRMRAA